MVLIQDKFIENRDLPSLCLDKSFSDFKIVNKHEDESAVPGTGKKNDMPPVPINYYVP